MVFPSGQLEPVTTPLPPAYAVSSSSRWSGRRYRWGLLPIAIALSLGSIYFFATNGSTQPEPAVTDALPVDAIAVEPVTSYTLERTYTGEVVAGRSSALGFERAGTLMQIWVDEGDRVSVGQPLAQLDIRTLEAQRQQLAAERQAALAQLRELQAGPRSEEIATATAAVTEIEQQLALARLQRDRREDLYAQGAISREELDREQYNTGALENRLAQAQSQLAELQAGTRTEQIDAQTARVQQLEASMRQLDIDLAKSTLQAPFAGTVSTRSADEGMVVNGGQALLSLVEADSLEARIGVPPEIAAGLTVGNEQTLQVGDRTYPATVTALLPELDAASRTVTVVLAIAARDLTVGQTARLLLTETQPAEGLWLPITALVPSERGLWSVYVLAAPAPDEPNPNRYTVSRRDVEVIHTEADRALVSGTLQPGERAIVSGTHRIVPGQRVEWSDL